jgi:predicted  nucleic acid-binding Zn-ribbon protein
VKTKVAELLIRQNKLTKEVEKFNNDSKQKEDELSQVQAKYDDVRRACDAIEREEEKMKEEWKIYQEILSSPIRGVTSAQVRCLNFLENL